MLSTVATLASVFVSSIGIGHIDRHGNVPTSYASNVQGHTLSLYLPPRTEVYVRGDCHWLDAPRVTVNVGTDSEDMPVARWTQDRTVEMFGKVAFNGVSFANLSNRGANVEAHIFDGCRSTS